MKLRTRIVDCFRAAAAEPDPDAKKKLLTFHVVGAGFTGVEMAGELAEYAPFLCRSFEIDRSLVTICNLDILPRVVPNLPEKLSAKIQRRLEKMGVRVLLGDGVTQVGADFIEYTYSHKTYRDTANTVIWVAGIEGSGITLEAASKLPSTGRGRINTDAHLRSVEDGSVYIAGDNMFYIPEGESAPVPQMVENCEQSSHTIAHNLYCAITGDGEPEQYAPKFTA